MGRPDTNLVMVDPQRSGNVEAFLKECVVEGLNASFVQESDLKCPLVDTDLLFIDTWHV